MFWRRPRVVGVLPLPPWFSAWCVPDAATATQDLALRMTASVTDGDVRHVGMVAQMSFAGPHVITGSGVRYVPLPAHHASARRWIVVLSQAWSSAGSPSSERSTRRRVETPSTKASIAAARLRAVASSRPLWRRWRCSGSSELLSRKAASASAASGRSPEARCSTSSGSSPGTPIQRWTMLAARREPSEDRSPSRECSTGISTRVAARKRPSFPPKERVIRLGETPAASATPLTVIPAYPCRANWRCACSRIRCLVAAASRTVMCMSIHLTCMLIHMMSELRERLGRTRRVTTPWSDDGTRGVTGATLDELLDRWANGYDWGVHERRIGELPWVTVAVGGTELHVIHQRSEDPSAPGVVLLHGWPDSVLRFGRVQIGRAHV